MPNRFAPLCGDGALLDDDDDWSSQSGSSVSLPPPPKVKGWGPGIRPLNEVDYQCELGLPIWGRNCSSHRFLKEKGVGKASKTLKYRDAQFIVWPERPFVEFAHSCRRLENAAFTLAEGALSRPNSSRKVVRNTLKALLYGYDCRLGYLRYPAGRALELPRSLKRKVFQALRLLGSHRQAVNSLEAERRPGATAPVFQLSPP